MKRPEKRLVRGEKEEGVRRAQRGRANSFRMGSWVPANIFDLKHSGVDKPVADRQQPSQQQQQPSFNTITTTLKDEHKIAGLADSSDFPNKSWRNFSRDLWGEIRPPK